MRLTRNNKIALGALGALFVVVCGCAGLGAALDDPENPEPAAVVTSAPGETGIGTVEVEPTTEPPKPSPTPKKTTKKPAPPVVDDEPDPVYVPPPPRDEPDPGPANAYYANCTAVRAAGGAPLYAGEPGYSRKLDRDGDGVACEN